jgi:hypothetical protein
VPSLTSVAGIDITANRLFGPQPRTATYLCIWKIHYGHIKTLLSSASAGKILMAAGNALRFNFSDPLNAPAADYIVPIDPDGETMAHLCTQLTQVIMQ